MITEDSAYVLEAPRDHYVGGADTYDGAVLGARMLVEEGEEEAVVRNARGLELAAARRNEHGAIVFRCSGLKR